MKPQAILTSGLASQILIPVQLLGLCSALAASASLQNGAVMGAAVTGVLVLSNLLTSLLGNLVDGRIRLAAYTVVIIGIVSAAGLIIRAYLPALADSPGFFVPLVAVGCLVFFQADALSLKIAPLPSVLDGLATGLAFTLVLCVLSAVREILGTGALWNLPLFGESFQPALLMVTPAGGLLTLGFLIAAIQHIGRRKEP